MTWNKSKTDPSRQWFMDSDCGKYRINKTGSTPPQYMAVRLGSPSVILLVSLSLDECKQACG